MTSKSIKIQEISFDYVPQVDPREWPVEAYKIAFQALNVQGCIKLVAFDGAEAVGFAAYRVSPEEGCELVSLASKYPGGHIGTALVDAIRDKYDVWVVSDRKAEKFYERLGFKQIDIKKGRSVRDVRKVYQWTT